MDANQSSQLSVAIDTCGKPPPCALHNPVQNQLELPINTQLPSDRSSDNDPFLAELTAAWPALPNHARQTILSIVHSVLTPPTRDGRTEAKVNNE